MYNYYYREQEEDAIFDRMRLVLLKMPPRMRTLVIKVLNQHLDPLENAELIAVIATSDNLEYLKEINEVVTSLNNFCEKTEKWRQTLNELENQFKQL